VPGFLDWIDESPGLFDFVRARKECSVAAHRIEQQTFGGFRARLAEGRSVMEIHFNWLDAKACAGHLGMNPQRDSFVGLNTNDEHVQVPQIFIEQHCRRFFEVNGNFSRRFRKPFAHSHVHRHVGPAPVVDKQTQGDERLSLRICIYVLLLPITEDGLTMDLALRVLAANNIGCDFAARPAMKLPYDFDFFVANAVGAEVCWRFHRDKT
jgi:hypothetical protein